MRRIAALSFACLLVACGGGDDGVADDTVGDDTVGDDSVGDDGGDDGGDDDSYTLTFGPVSVEPGVEATQCATLRLGNSGPVKINRFHNTLSTGSHHFIVYRDNAATAETPTPEPCTPFAGTLNPNGDASPLMITQRAEETLELPAGVAYSFEADQFIRLEMHFINGGDVTADITATAEFTVLPDAEFENEAEFLFIGSPDIDLDLDPGESQSLNAYFPLPSSLDGINFFAVTGHTHKLGTDMDISTAPSAAGPRTEIYDPTPFSWSEPETAMVDFALAPGSGFDFTCTWANQGATPISASFGESANDEMCFFWAYYYPSRGAKVCVHTDQFGGFDICCPDAGETICGILN
jgi:hypothetical protein